MVNPSNERRVVQDEEGGYAVYPSKAEVWDKSGGICWYCGKVLHPFRDFTIDHFVPMVRRGTEAIENLVPACRDCNSRKGHRPLEYLREALAGREGARLTPEQKAYFTQQGFPFPPEPRYEFWFEKMGRTMDARRPRS